MSQVVTTWGKFLDRDAETLSTTTHDTTPSKLGIGVLLIPYLTCGLFYESSPSSMCRS